MKALRRLFVPDDDASLPDMVRDLQEAGFGDRDRLSYIMERIENGRTIYDSDRQYVEQKFRQLRDSITGRGEETQKPPTPADDPDVQNIKDSQRHAPDEPSGIGRDSPTVQESRDRSSSRAWYLLPLFLGVLGGVIAYARLRKRHRARAYKTLGLGTGLTVVFLALVIMAASDFTVGESSPADKHASGHDPQQTRNMALAIPYDSLLNEPDAYKGEIVHYEGTVVQAQKHPSLDKYIMRVGVTPGLLSATDIVWLNYDPISEEEVAWMDDLVRNASPFGDSGQNDVRFWGMSVGIREYSSLVGNTVAIPEIDGIILERIPSGVPQSSAPPPPPPPPPEGVDPETRNCCQFRHHHHQIPHGIIREHPRVRRRGHSEGIRD